MTLDSGTRLGPYEILSRIGAGGMGEVFKARDTRLDRSVAIKVLPSALAHDAQLKVRFEREARTISQLSHPHICTLHDVGSENGVSYLVMELLEGESLAARIARGPLPLAEVLRYGAQIADALANAHRHGVTHRDLKPGNIMLTKSGAKLLDFGLAKAATPAIAANDATVARTSEPITAQGTLLGTFQYMAPEQLEGAEADARTDIFALGAVLYEMLTGKRAFEGKTRTSLIAAIVAAQPRSIAELQPMTPAALEHVVERCLRKDPEERWQSARDVAEELRWVAETPAAKPSGIRGSARLPWILVAICALVGAGLAAWVALRPAPARRVVRAFFPAPAGKFLNDAVPTVALSPDGSRVVFQTFDASGSATLRLRAANGLDSTPIQGGDFGRGAVFSPDGEWIAFIANGRVRKVPAAGGSPVVLGEATNPRGLTWSADGSAIYYSPTPASGIWRVSASGGDARPVTTPDASRGENSHRWPSMLPDGRHLLMTIRTATIASFDDAKIAALSLETGTWQTVLEGGSFPRFAPGGHLLFARAGSIHAIRFDPATLKTSGAPVRVVTDVDMLRDNGVAHFDVARDGSLAYVPATPNISDTHLVSLGPDGAKTMNRTPRAHLFVPRVSPDGRFIALRVGAANDDIWIYDIARDSFTRLSFEGGDEDVPIWTADGKHVIYTNSDSKGFRLVMRPVDGSGEARELRRSTEPILAWSAAPNGRSIIVSTWTQQTKRDLHLLSLETGTLQPLVVSPFNDGAGAFSPSGKWIAYVSNESGRPEVYVRSVAQGGGRWAVSTNGGVEPRWTPDGTAIYYRNGEELWRAPMTESAGAVSIGSPVFALRIERISDGYDVGPDGRIVTAQLRKGSLGASGFHYVHNWTAELERRVPVHR
jgi:Tol biopolymer transport system component